MMKTAWVVIRKELLDGVRDRPYAFDHLHHSNRHGDRCSCC